MAAAIARIEAPLVNANEPEARVVELHVAPYSHVARGQRIATLETSKATMDVEAERDGFVGPVHVALGDHVVAGELICELFAEMPSRSAAQEEEPPTGDGRARGVTKRAARLAAELGVDLSALPGTGFITEDAVRAAAAAAAPALDDAVRASIHDRAVVLFGGGGLARTLIELVRAADGPFEIVGVVDDGLARGTDVLGVPVIGDSAQLAALAGAGLRWAANAVGAVGRMRVRGEISARIAAAGLRGPVLVEPTASVAASAELADGVQVHAQATVSALARVGANTIVNTSAVVSHDCVVGAESHIAPGALLAGEVTIGDGVLVGMGATVPVGVRVGDGAVVGSGATLRGDVPAGEIVRAGAVWPPR
jgi:sugar O-acyltransferase (sialic acid O-acetyltransferase NeuD family)